MTDTAKRVIKIFLAVALVLLCVTAGSAVYFHFADKEENFRDAVDGVSPYRIVNNLGQPGELTMVCAQPSYPLSVEKVRVNVRNDAEEWLIPDSTRPDEWLLEFWTGGAWHTLKADGKNLCWDFPEEDYSGEIRPTGVVAGDGGEQGFLCDIWVYYPLPLEAGRYRIVFPKMRLRETGTLAAEFEVAA